MELLYGFKKPYKYIADCTVAQRCAAGFTNFTSAYYDRNSDNCYHFYFPKDKGTIAKDRPLIFGLVTIFVVSYAFAK